MNSWRDRVRAGVLRWLGINALATLPEEEAHRIIGDHLLRNHRVFGDASRVVLGANVVLNDALLNTSSGRIVVGDHAFCGHGVSLLTGTHDYGQLGFARQAAVPTHGNDIVVGAGVWIGSNATVLGPCTIGDDAVIGSGSVVTGSVPARAVYAGVPARLVRSIDART